jgi:lipoate-protein ligase A
MRHWAWSRAIRQSKTPKKKQVPGSKGIASVPSPVANIRALYPSFAALSAREFLDKLLKEAVRYYSQVVHETEHQGLKDAKQYINELQKIEQQDLNELQEFKQEELNEIEALSRQKYQSKAWNESK